MTSLLLNPEQVFLDNNGHPLSGGFVYTYVPLTLTLKNTWEDESQNTLNSNPVILDSAGRALIYGSGSYRYIVTDSASNLIYDQLTKSYLGEDAISAVMLPVVGAATLATARTLMGIDAAIQSAINGAAQTTGPIGPTGPQGVQGNVGPTGPNPIGSVNVQDFQNNGTWTKPIGNFTIIQIWGAGAAGTDQTDGGGGGGGGYFGGIFLTSQLPSSVSIILGTGGVFVGGNIGPGASGSNTTFGSILTMTGGTGGTATFDENGNPTPHTGNDGFISSASITPILGSSEGIGLLPGSGGNFLTSIGTLSVFAGSGGNATQNGVYPGGGGGGNGGSGASARILVTTF